MSHIRIALAAAALALGAAACGSHGGTSDTVHVVHHYATPAPTVTVHHTTKVKAKATPKAKKVKKASRKR